MNRMRKATILLAAVMLVSLAGCNNGQGTTATTIATTTPSTTTTATAGVTTSAAPTASATAGTTTATGTASASGAPTTSATTAATSTTATTAAASTGPTAEPVIRAVNAYPGLTFDQPLYFTTAGDGTQEVYVVERTGRIKVFTDRPDAREARVFLDLSSRVDLGGQEKGLLGLAFHPQFRSNGQFFVNYTTRTETVIARYTRPTGAGAIDPAGGQVLMTFTQPYANHNGGHLAFGPDGFLYIASGDGGSSGDPNNNAQNRNSLLGKILRIDVDRPSGGRAYGIPTDNPFADADAGSRPEIYAYGLRNPWRFCFDAAGTLWAADVGQNRREEIDIIEKGGNYGWAAFEGTQAYKAVPGVDQAGLKPPVFEYERSQGQSITGGYVYNGSQLPALKGAYVYGDFVSGRVWALWRESGQVRNRLILESRLKISSFGVDSAGELRIVDFGGGIHRLQAQAG